MSQNLDEVIFENTSSIVFVLIGLVSATIIFFVDLGSHVRVEALAVSFCALAMSIVISRPLHRKVWYWSIMAIILGCHAVAIVFVPWPANDDIVGATLIPIGLADLGLILAIIYGAAKVFMNLPS